ncbi:MAG: FAD-dependent oxidoreductase [Gemmatimonadales bacterium]
MHRLWKKERELAVVGSSGQPLRVAVIGSGPAGFYVADHLFKRSNLVVQVDMYERLPTPYGLVRFGVAPDHEKIKNVTRVFDRIASNPGFRFFGNVDVGKHLSPEDLRRHYHQICFATGAQMDRRMGIPGEDLAGSHPATEFVAWFNGHPDFRDREFDLSAERVAVIGVGNVAVDVARILCRTPEELARTDIADHALEVLGASRVKEVYMLGRRGPAQAAFTVPEVKELGEMPGADVHVRADEVELDELSRAEAERSEDGAVAKKLAVLEEFSRRSSWDKPRQLFLRFLVSPVELLGSDVGHVSGLKLVKNRLYAGSKGKLRAQPTEEFEQLPVDLVFRSVGYRGTAIEGLPFDEAWATVPNERGRIESPDGRHDVVGLYVSGWIKRGPTGVIGTNKPDAAETVQSMVEDVIEGKILRPVDPDPVSAERAVSCRQPDCVSYADWRQIDRLETERGEASNRPRVKFTAVEEMLSALGKE